MLRIMINTNKIRLSNLLVGILIFTISNRITNSWADTIDQQHLWDYQSKQNTASDRLRSILEKSQWRQSDQQISVQQQIDVLHQQKQHLEQLELAKQRKIEQKKQQQLELARQKEAALTKQQQLATQQRIKQQQIAKKIEEINYRIADLRHSQQEAIATAEQAHEIVTTQPNCYRYITTRGWRNPCERRYPDYRRQRYADLQRKVSEDDIYLCTKVAQPRENTRCLLTHMITDRNTGYRHTEYFTVPKRVRAYATVKDFWRTRELCINIKDETHDRMVIKHSCFPENTEIPLPYSDTIDQRFSVAIPVRDGSRLGGVYITSDNINIDRTPVEEAQRKMRKTIDQLEAQISALETHKRNLTCEKP